MPRKRRLAVNLSRAVQSKHCSLTACAIHVPNLVPEIYPCSSKTPCQSRSHGSVDTRQQYARLQLKGSSDYSDSPRKGTTKSTKEPHPLPHPRLREHTHTRSWAAYLPPWVRLRRAPAGERRPAPPFPQEGGLARHPPLPRPPASSSPTSPFPHT